jgi:hypothetical protein
MSCLDIANQVPPHAARLSPPPKEPVNRFTREFLGAVSQSLLDSLVASGKSDLAARLQRCRDYILVLEGSVAYGAITSNQQSYYTTLVNMAVLLRELASICEPQNAGISDLSGAFNSAVQSLFDAEIRAAAMTLHLWIYYQLADARSKLEHKLHRIVRNAEYTYEDWATRRNEVRASLSRLGEVVKALDWSALEGYEARDLPANSWRAVPLTRVTIDAPALAVDELYERISARLTPISTAMQELADTVAVPFPEYVRQVQAKRSVQVMVPPGGNVSFGDSIYNWEDKSVKNIEVTLGDGTVFHGDFAVAEVIRNSFNRAESAESPAELKRLLKDLSVEVAKLTETMSPDRAKETADDLDMLVKEATRDAPRKKWYELSAGGLLEAAKGVGTAGSSIIELVSKVVGLLTGGH